MLPATESGIKILAEDSEFFKGYLEQLKTAKFYPTTKEAWKTAQYAVIEAVQNVAAGIMDAQSALDAAQAKVLDE
jgi:maltose-binding protein MalE